MLTHCECFRLASLRSWIAFFSESDSAPRALPFSSSQGSVRKKTAGRGFERPVTSELTSAQCPRASPSPLPDKGSSDNILEMSSNVELHSQSRRSSMTFGPIASKCFNISSQSKRAILNIFLTFVTFDQPEYRGMSTARFRVSPLGGYLTKDRPTIFWKCQAMSNCTANRNEAV